jgi:hypothetical protein
MKLLGKIVLVILLVASGFGVLGELLPEPTPTPEFSSSVLASGGIWTSGGVVFAIGDGYVMEAVKINGLPWPMETMPKMEVSPPQFPWCTGAEGNLAIFNADEKFVEVGTSMELGDGLQATKEVIDQFDLSLSRYSSLDMEYEGCDRRTNVFKWVYQSRINGFTGWYIPTSHELRTLLSAEDARDQLKIPIDTDAECLNLCSGTFVTSTVKSGKLIFWNQRDNSMGTYSGYPEVVVVRKATSRN